MHSRLREFCRDQLRARPKGVTLQHVAEATGLKRNWLKELSEDRVPECSCAKLEVLYMHFTGRELAL